MNMVHNLIANSLIGGFFGMVVYSYFNKNFAKSCYHNKCYNPCIKDFNFCFLHRGEISIGELSKKIPGCKYIESSVYCNSSVSLSETYCTKHKCSHDKCGSYVLTHFNVCHYHYIYRILCRDCGTSLNTGTLCKKCEKKRILENTYDDIYIKLEYLVTELQCGNCSEYDESDEIEKTEKIETFTFKLPKYFKKSDLVKDNYNYISINKDNEKLLYLFKKDSEYYNYCSVCKRDFNILNANIFVGDDIDNKNENENENITLDDLVLDNINANSEKIKIE